MGSSAGDEIPKRTVERLPRYRQSIEEMLATGKTHASSKDIGRSLGLSAAQIRKDLNYFGNFGVRGKGYDLRSLLDTIQEIMGLDRTIRCVLIGVGNIGRALLAFPGFQEERFHIEAAFDVDPNVIGTDVEGVTVQPTEDLESYLDRDPPPIAIVAVPAQAAVDVLDRVVDAGVKSVLNFAPVVYEPPPDVMIRSVDLRSDLEVLSYFLGESTN